MCKAKVVNGQLAALANEAEKAGGFQQAFGRMLETDKESLKNRKTKYRRTSVWEDRFIYTTDR
jgi:nitroimidazol reductase NimA-like FMN-containing flavoprotein (pyridoxamine 5'-phosphate oxidase superfamily)